MSLSHYEDFVVGAAHQAGPYALTAAEIREFASRWDPLPMHLEAHPGAPMVSASGAHLMAIRTALLHRMNDGEAPAIAAALGWERVRFHRPAFAGDSLSLRLTVVERRPSSSRPGFGVVTCEVVLIDREGAPVLSHLDVILVAMRQP
ncbi:MAG: hypothetical protein R3B09_25935 [Nannocystaceae bacterium]